jgi:4-hydroxybenzoate polyprenyltransferase
MPLFWLGLAVAFVTFIFWMFPELGGAWAIIGLIPIAIIILRAWRRGKS